MNFDVLIVGAGPSGLSAAIRLKTLALAQGRGLDVCVIEKGAEIGAHILSGAVIEPKALNELIPDWKKRGAPLNTPAIMDEFLFLSESGAVKLPTPPQMKNHGNYIISLGNFCRWLALQAEELGVQIFPGFPGKEVMFNLEGQVLGVLTADRGVAKNGNRKENYQPGIELTAKYTLFAEGARGSLTRQLFEKFNLRKKCNPQTYAIGIKELWEVDPKNHHPGKVTHTIGWPLDSATYGGSFIYHLENNQVAIGYAVGLDYKNPYLNPFKEFQRFKAHPVIRGTFAGGRRISYGARAISEGGYQSIPKLTFPGGAIIGDAAGFLNVPKIKGTHTAMKSGMVAADAIFLALKKGDKELVEYPKMLKKSWVYKELRRARNIRPAFRFGLWFGLIYSAIDTYIFRGLAPWTLKNHADHLALKPADKCRQIEYPKPDGQVSFDLMSSVFISNTNHAEDQPSHLVLTDYDLTLEHSLKVYDSPETRYCPAGVYEIVRDEKQKPQLQVNAQNCVHCKTCDIKDPDQAIVWVTPEGGDGPNYPNM